MIEIPDSLLQESIKEAEPSLQDEVDINENLAGPSDPINDAVADALESLIEIGDDIAKSYDLKGLGRVPADKYGKLVGVVYRKNFSITAQKNGPEYLLIALTGIIIADNLLELRKNNLKKGSDE